MKPADGSYRLRPDPNPPGTPDMRFRVDGLGAEATFGHFDYYDPPDDLFMHDTVNVSIRFTDSTHFQAIVGAGTGAEKTYSGTYAQES